VFELESPPVAITFVEQPPAGVPRAPLPALAVLGNRVYSGAGDTEAYFAIPGPHLDGVEQNLRTMVQANWELEESHRARAAASVVGAGRP
jgi:uncharacterized protein (DUF169 family)